MIRIIYILTLKHHFQAYRLKTEQDIRTGKNELPVDRILKHAIGSPYGKFEPRKPTFIGQQTLPMPPKIEWKVKFN